MPCFQINSGYTTFSPQLIDRFVETGRFTIPGQSWPRLQGHYQWRIGDQASLYLDTLLLWMLVEVRITRVINSDTYRVVITGFDGTRTRLADLAIGDEFTAEERCFFALWAPGQTREDVENPQRIDEEASPRRAALLPSDRYLH